MINCEGCGKEAEEICSGNYCKACHVSCSWEDCITQTFEARSNLNGYLEIGVPRKEAIRLVKTIYPNAKLEE